MFRIGIIAVGKMTQPFARDGVREYLERIKPFYNVSVTEIPEQRPRGSHTADLQRAINAEGLRITKALTKPDLPATALASEGRMLSSEEFAAMISEQTLKSSGCIFIIGGPLGLSDEVKESAGALLSLSAMTLPHQLARLVLLEQLYRAAAINFNIAYHK
ncbi:MAG: 23S rRNA (pseudouridine(1915)-N(3))-methyltransferase RlmH [Oscillospiraceae bacterium]|nr:23S rRNA (pseudouridine(1915)-N(3))-methyltransferase RlmH [Oscillospiraceae bacterium]